MSRFGTTKQIKLRYNKSKWSETGECQAVYTPPLSLNQILSLLEQTILGQTSNLISYHPRYEILSSVCSPQKAKNMVKKKVELLQTNDEIFLKKNSATI